MPSESESVCALADGSRPGGWSPEAVAQGPPPAADVGRRLLGPRVASCKDITGQLAALPHKWDATSVASSPPQEGGAGFILPLDGAPAFVEPPVVVDAVQSGGDGADGRVPLQAAHAAVGVHGVGERLALLHVGVRGGQVPRYDHGYGVLQLLPALVPKARAHGLEVEHLGVDVAEAAAGRPDRKSVV